MREYTREFPQFSLCGLNCGLCPRYHTEGSSKCPGCGGVDFNLKHPACAVISCSRKHGSVEFCFQCSSYPCERYEKTSESDSFISYKNILEDLESAKNNLKKYKKQLNEKIEVLQFLLVNYDDGRRKSYYCTAINLLSLKSLKEILSLIKKNTTPDMDLKNRAKIAAVLIEEKASEEGVKIKLRK